MTTTLHLGKNLTVPLQTVTQKLAWLGVTGSGKTYGATKLAELLWAAHAQFIVLDPVGVWYGLRLAKDGKTPSDVAVPIFGGLHGDVPLEPTGGALLANLVVDKTLSAVIDVSQFESDADKARFARDFADRFFFRKKAAPAAVHLFLEECQEFVPQNPQKGEERMLHAFIRMQKLGRNFGIGSSYLSQRPQEVNKKALNMAQTLFVFRTTGTHERKAIESWIADKALDQNIAGDLPKIETGDCHVWSPEFLRISETVHILAKHTYNASATPEVGATAKARELAPIDLDQVRADMAATIEKAKADDPRELRKQIAELKKELAGQVSIAPRQEKPARVVEKFVLKDGQLRRAEGIVSAIAHEVARHEAAVKDRLDLLRELTQEISVAIATTRQPIQPITPTTTVPRSPQARRVAPASGNERRPARLVSDSDTTLGRAERAILTAGVQRLPKTSSRAQLAVLSGYSVKSSSFANAVGRLRSLGLMNGGGDQNRATDAGILALGDFDPLPTGRELIAHWMQHVGKAERALFEVFVKHYPHDVDREAVSAESGYSETSSSFANALGKLRTLELVRGWHASEDLEL